MTTGAEEVGFEPTVTLRPQRFSRPSDSSALALLQMDFCDFTLDLSPIGSPIR